MLNCYMCWNDSERKILCGHNKRSKFKFILHAAFFLLFLRSFSLTIWMCFLFFLVRLTENKWQTRDLHETTINFPVMKCSIHSSQYHQPTLEWWRAYCQQYIVSVLVLNGKENKIKQNKTNTFIEISRYVHFDAWNLAILGGFSFDRMKL